MSAQQGPDLVLLVSHISDSLVQSLATGGYPALSGGAILLGKQHVYELTPPPRIIMTPVGSVFSGSNVYSHQIMSAGQMTDEARYQKAARSLMNEQVEFEVRCWSVASVTDLTTQRDEDYNATRTLYHAVIQAMWTTLGPATKGAVEIGSGKWTDVSQQNVFGREFVFGVRIPTPVLAELIPFDPATAFAPSGVGSTTTVSLTLPTGATEVAESIVQP